MRTVYDTKIQFAAKSEVKEFFEEEARKQRRSFADFMRIVLEDLKTKKQTEQKEQPQECSQ